MGAKAQTIKNQTMDFGEPSTILAISPTRIFPLPAVHRKSTVRFCHKSGNQPVTPLRIRSSRAPAGCNQQVVAGTHRITTEGTGVEPYTP